MLVERTVVGLHSFLESLLQQQLPQGPDSLLDIGCGTGAWLARVKPLVKGCLMGVDHEGPPKDTEFDIQPFDINTDSPERLGKFQVVTCIEVIEHIENIGCLLDVICASLAPHGVAIITTPNIESLRARLRALLAGKLPSFDEKSDPTHLMPILHDSMAKMLKRRRMYIARRLAYPEHRHKSYQYRSSIVLAEKMASLLLSNKFYGDTSVYIIKHGAVVA